MLSQALAAVQQSMTTTGQNTEQLNGQNQGLQQATNEVVSGRTIENI